MRELINGHDALLEGFRAYLREGYDDPIEEQRPKKGGIIALLCWRGQRTKRPRRMWRMFWRGIITNTTCKKCEGHKRKVEICLDGEFLSDKNKSNNNRYYVKCARHSTG